MQPPSTPACQTWSAPSTPNHIFNPTALTPRTPRTASAILAIFSPIPQPKKKQLQTKRDPRSFPIIMNTDRRLRDKKAVSYDISDSDNGDTSTTPDSSFSSPEKPKRKRREVVDLDDEPEEVEPMTTPPPRLSAAGHSLRQHKDLRLSLQARENADKSRRRKRKVPNSNSSTKVVLKAASNKAGAVPRTARNEIRDFINNETAGKRANFFVANADLFLPLLPPDSNHIQKLVTQHGRGAGDKIVPYQALERQPAG